MENQELELAKFKLESGDFDEAKPILERLAVTNNSPTAWAYLGILRLHQLETGKYSAQQALECFKKSAELAPTSRQDLQNIFSRLVLTKAEFIYKIYQENRGKIYKSWLKMSGNMILVLFSALVGLGTKSRFGSLAAVGGATAGGIGIGKNISTRGQAKHNLELCNTYLKDIAICIEDFCSSNNQAYRYFIDGITSKQSKTITTHFNKKILPILNKAHNEQSLKQISRQK